MKQGRASISGSYDRKVEPSANGIGPGWAGQLGQAQGTHVTGEKDTNYRGEKMHVGRGYMAPKNKSQSTSNSGSQGRH